MATKTRLYRVKSKSTGTIRLVEATGPSTARSFVARSDFEVDIPEAHETFAMGAAGIKVELATGSPLSDETRTAMSQSQIPTDPLPAIEGAIPA